MSGAASERSSRGSVSNEDVVDDEEQREASNDKSSTEEDELQGPNEPEVHSDVGADADVEAAIEGAEGGEPRVLTTGEPRPSVRRGLSARVSRVSARLLRALGVSSTSLPPPPPLPRDALDSDGDDADDADADASADDDDDRHDPALGDALLARLEQHLRLRPQRQALVWLNDRGETAGSLTFQDLLLRADAARRFIQAKWRLPRGGKVLLVFQPGLEFVCALVGCLLGGFVAVPVVPPETTNPGPELHNLRAAVRATGVTSALTHDAFARARGIIGNGKFPRELQWASVSQGLRIVEHVQDAGVIAHRLGAELLRGADDSELALVQLTAGAGGDPKPVMLSHGNLAAALWAAQRALRASADDVAVYWAPPYQGAGLLGGVLQTLYAGGCGVLMSPETFMRNPLLWLRAVDEHHADLTWAPGFAYELCAARATDADKIGLDVGCCRRWSVGAEPVSAETLAAFSKAFAPCGFDVAAWDVQYGCAEFGALVTAHSPPRMPHTVRLSPNMSQAPGSLAEEVPDTRAHARTLVGVGDPLPSTRVAIVHPETLQRLWRPGALGEVWVAGPAKAVGYYGRRRETRQQFRARIAPPTPEDDAAARRASVLLQRDDDSWLRTGDMGFLLHGELFVCGRLADAMLLDARSVFPDDLERTAQLAAPQVLPGGVAVFSVAQPGSPAEAVVVVAEVQHRRATASRRVLRAAAGAAAGTASGLRGWLGALAGSDADAGVQRRPYPFIEGRFTEAALLLEPTATPEDELRRTAQRIRHMVQMEHDVRVLDVSLVPRNALQRTATGKVRRQDARRQYVRGALGAVFSSRKDPLLHTLVEGSGAAESAVSASLDDAADDDNDGAPGADLERGGSGSEAEAHARGIGAGAGADVELSRDTRRLLRKAQYITGNRALDAGDDLFDAGVGATEMAQLSSEVAALAGRALPADFLVRHRSVMAAVDGVKKLDSDPLAPQQRRFNIPERGTDWALPRALLALLQLLGVAVLLVLLAAPLLPAYELGRRVQPGARDAFGLGEPWTHVQLPGGTAPVMVFGLLLPLVVPVYMLSLTLLVVLVKWTVVGRWREGSVRVGALLFVRWWLVDRLLCMWETIVGRFLVRTQLLTLMYRLLGADLAPDCKLRTFLREPDLVTVGPRSEVDAQLVTRLFDPLERTANFRRIVVGADARLRETAVVLPGVTVRDEVVLEQLSVMSEGLVTEAGCVYAGAPCYVVAPAAQSNGGGGNGRPGAAGSGGGGKRGGGKQWRSAQRPQPQAGSYVGGRVENGTYGARDRALTGNGEGTGSCLSRSCGFAAGLLLHFAGLMVLLYAVFAASVPALWLWGGLARPYRAELGRYAPLIFWTTVYCGTMLCAGLLAVPVKWLLLGRRRPGPVSSLDCTGSGSGWREWFADNLLRTASDGLLKLLEGSQTALLFPRMLGAGVGAGSFVAEPLSTLPPSRADMVRVGRHCEVDAFTAVVEQGGMRARLRLGDRCEVGLLAAAGGQSVVPHMRGAMAGVMGVTGVTETADGGTRMEAGAALGAATRLSGETLVAGRLKAGEAVFPRPPGALANAARRGGDSVTVHWSALEEAWVVLSRLLLVALLLGCLVPSYELAVLLLYDGAADFYTAAYAARLASGAVAAPMLEVHVALLLLGGSLGLALASFALLQRAVTLLALGFSRHLLQAPCRGSTYMTANALTAFLEGLLVPVIHGTALHAWYCAFMGARVGSDVFLYTKHVRAHQLHTFLDGCVVDEHARVTAHELRDGELRVGPTTVGAFAYVAPFALVVQSSTVGHERVLDPYAVATPANLVPRDRASTAYTTQRYYPRGRSARISHRLSAVPLPDGISRARRGSSII